MNWQLKKTFGKAQARDQLPQLVEFVQHEGEPIAITDYGKTVAVIIGIAEYEFLLSVLKNRSQITPQRPICNIKGDLNLSSKAISNDIQKSIEKSANEL